jgi:hypothetical protein
MSRRQELVEIFAALEHTQWTFWSKALAAREHLSPERVERWKSLWIPYDELSEENKEFDRIWARRIVDALDENLLDIEAAHARLVLDIVEEDERCKNSKR